VWKYIRWVGSFLFSSSRFLDMLWEMDKKSGFSMMCGVGASLCRIFFPHFFSIVQSQEAWVADHV